MTIQRYVLHLGIGKGQLSSGVECHIGEELAHSRKLLPIDISTHRNSHRGVFKMELLGQIDGMIKGLVERIALESVG